MVYETCYVPEATQTRTLKITKQVPVDLGQANACKTTTADTVDSSNGKRFLELDIKAESDSDVSKLRGQSPQSTQSTQSPQSTSSALKDTACPTSLSILASRNEAMKGDTLDSIDKRKSPSQSSGMETLSKKALNGFSNDPSSLERKEKPLLSEEWQFSDTFNTKGGALQGEHSDVQLKIPTGAIKEPESVKISGAVSVNLEEIHTELKLRKTQYIAGPVVEYSAGDADFRFNKPVEIIFPHFIETSAKGRMSVTVYEFSHKSELEIKELREIPVPEQSQGGETSQTDASDLVGGYWFGENNRVHMLVDHFSGYCLVAGCENLPPENLQLDLYAGHVDGHRSVAVRLVIRNEKLAVIKDFDKAQNQVANVKRMTKIDSQILRKLNPVPDVAGTQVCVCLVQAMETAHLWEHRKEVDGNVPFPAQKRVPLETFVSCKCRPLTPEIVEWALTPSSTCAAPVPDTFSCFVKAGYVAAPNADCPRDAKVMRVDIPRQ